MIRTAGPSLRAAARAGRGQNVRLRSRIPAARSYASMPPPNQHTVTSPSNTGRNLTIAGFVFGGLGLAVYYFQSRGGLDIKMLPVPMAKGGNHPSEGVLNQKSLKTAGLHAGDSNQDHLESAGLSKRIQAPTQMPSSDPRVTPNSPPKAVTDVAAEASNPSEGAFNEETGEINWDCPCLGGMADGPCGEQFKAAFSCFVFSEAEPKGMDCVDKFKMMQDCFREHPDIYGEEMEDEDADVGDSIGTTPESTLNTVPMHPDDMPPHPIPGNPPGSAKTPAQRANGPPGKPKDIPPENSGMFKLTPNNSVKKGPKYSEKQNADPSSPNSSSS